MYMIAYQETFTTGKIDDKKGDRNIVPIFYDKYKSLYNSVNYSHDGMRALKSKVDSLIKTECSRRSNVQNVSKKENDNDFHVLHRNDLANAVGDYKKISI